MNEIERKLKALEDEYLLIQQQKQIEKEMIQIEEQRTRGKRPRIKLTDGKTVVKREEE